MFDYPEEMLKIESLTSMGYGLSDSKKIEVPKTLPSEEVVVHLVKKDRGKLLSIVKPSPERVEARCSHFPTCGGCKLQHLGYENQLRWKESEVQKAFPERTPFLPIVPSPKIFEWRNKMEFSFSQDKSGNRYLGLVMQEGKGRVLNVERCHLANPWMSEVLPAVRAWWEKEGISAYNPYRDTGSLRSLILREGMTTGDRLVMLHVSGNAEFALSKRAMESFKEVILPFTPESYLSIFILIHQAIKGQPTQFYEIQLFGKEFIRERMLDRLFLISPRSFFQPNSFQAPNLYETALNHLKLTGSETVYDLYCGTGTLGMAASSLAKEVIGVEISKEACLDANLNISINKIANMRVFNGDVAEVLKGDFPPADVVLVDPPRTGLSKEAIQEILKLKPKKILYISCNFKTCALNVLDFIESGYHLTIVQPVDQFPHTYHVESIALLVKEF